MGHAAGTPKRPGRSWLWLGVLLPALLFGGYIALPDPDPRESAAEASAIVRCREAVRDVLNAPKSTSFSGEKASGVGVTGPYQLTGTVDVENFYGADFRLRFSCVANLVAGDAKTADAGLIGS